jgi:hypothetical protein
MQALGDIVTCLSKWIAKDNSQGFDVCVVQSAVDVRRFGHNQYG